MKEFNLTFKESWFQDESIFFDEYTNEYKLKILEDLGESWNLVENDEGILEWTPVHKYKVEKVE